MSSTHQKLAVGLIMMTAACTGTTTGDSDGAKGNLQVFVEAEETVPEGLSPGTGEENIVDGWTVEYTEFLIAVGDVRLGRSDASETQSESKVYVVDLRNLPTTGLVIADFQDISAVRWDQFGFSLPRATTSAIKAEGVSQPDFERMVQNGYSLYVEGTISNPSGMRCPRGLNCEIANQPIHFTFALDKGTRFSACAAPDSAAGVAVPTGGTAQAKPTIHGDHWFFTNVTQGAELTERRAQWLANSDLDGNDDVTQAELEQVQPAEVFPASQGYSLSGAVIPINSAWDYVRAQAHTLGDFQGEGECPTREILP